MSKAQYEFFQVLIFYFRASTQMDQQQLIVPILGIALYEKDQYTIEQCSIEM